MVDLLSHHPKVKGSSQPAAAGTRRKKMTGNTKGGSITVPLTSCLTGLESTVMTTDNFFFAKQTNPNQSNRRSMVQ